MQTKIKLTRHAVSEANIPPIKRYAWPLVVTAEGINIPSEIFVYHIGAKGEAIPGDKFECIASVTQIYEIPINTGLAVTTEKGIPYYRTSILEMVCRSPEEMEEVWTEIQNEVFWLLKNFDLGRTVQGVDYVEITNEAVTAGSFDMQPPIRVQLSYHPAGTATVTEDDVQGITAPDTSKMGWLPASIAPHTWTKPPGAFLYYNISADEALQDVWPPKEPYSGNMLTWNGLVLPYGVVYTVNKHGLWWLEYSPDVLMRYVSVLGAGMLNAPWPADYVSENHLGEVSPILTFVLYK